MGCGGSKSDTTTSQDASKTNKGQQGKGGNARGKGRNAGGKGGNQGKGNNKQQKNTGPILEKGYKKRIRENLRDASAGNDADHLEKCMEIFLNNHLEDGGDYSEAERRLEYLQIKKEIRDACMRNHPVVLEKAIERVKASPYQRQLRPYVERAQYLKQHQDELDTFRHDIAELDQSTVSEIRSYNHPPDGVHEAMVATYLCLGQEEAHLTDWSEVVGLMGRYGRDSLVREVAQADQKKISNHTAMRARTYLSRYSLEEVRAVSTGAAAFHVWASKMVGYDGKKKSDAGGQAKPLTNSATNKTQGTKSSSKPATPAQANKADNKNTPTKDKGKEKKDEKHQVNSNKQQQQGKAAKDTKTAANTNTKNNTAANAKSSTQNTPNKTTKKG